MNLVVKFFLKFFTISFFHYVQLKQLDTQSQLKVELVIDRDLPYDPSFYPKLKLGSVMYMY